MNIFVFLACFGIGLAQVVPEPKLPMAVRQVVPEPKLPIAVRQVVPEPKLIPEMRQVVPEPKQARMCNSRFSFSNVGGQGVLESPNYPNAYPNNYDMVVCLASPPGTRISISCSNFNVENSTNCVYDKVYLSLSGDLEFRDEVKFCGNSFPTQTSIANSLILAFHTDFSVVLSGYQCSINVVSIPTTTTTTTTAPSTIKTCTSRTQLTVGQTVDISSPGYPNPYPNNVDQVQCFTSPPGTTMTIACNPFNLEYQQTCAWDKLYLSLSGDLAFRDEKKFCGTNFTDQRTTSNQLNIGFKTDASVQNPGYKCTVRVVSSTGPTPTPTPPPTSTTGPDCECGLRNVEVSRIVNGTQAKPGEFPWRCYLRTANYDFFCGCSVINENWILTARHCTAAVEGTPLIVVVGAHNRSQAGPNERSIRVDRVVDHPAYNSRTQDNDVSLLHLSSPLTFNHDVSPVCIPWHLAAKNFSGTSVTASGWGTEKSGGDVQNTLMEVDLPVLTTEECQVYYGTSVTQNMICTYEPGKDTCQGDSGGSIDYLDTRRNGYYAIGVVSWGLGCAGRGAPGVYAKVTKYLTWIESSTQGEQFCRK